MTINEIKKTIAAELNELFERERFVRKLVKAGNREYENELANLQQTLKITYSAYSRLGFNIILDNDTEKYIIIN